MASNDNEGVAVARPVQHGVVRLYQPSKESDKDTRLGAQRIHVVVKAPREGAFRVAQEPDQNQEAQTTPCA